MKYSLQSKNLIYQKIIFRTGINVSSGTKAESKIIVNLDRKDIVEITIGVIFYILSPTMETGSDDTPYKKIE